MAVIKCKMCGGDLDISEGLSVCECEYCGTKQTVPAADNEKKLTLFARANRLRLANEFDKAAGVYESIVADFPEEAEAYWGMVLCRYGIEYVDDPATGKKVPTCHRVSFDSVLEDTDFDQACENADAIARRQYREEAKQIEEIRRGIIEVSGKEEPYDIFICYKETDENGDRTVDSVIAQDVYDALAEKGYRVFFSRISLEDKLGTEYEPYIFAALNSAKVMLAFGTDYEYYNAVWVKNEWSRFLKLMEKDKTKHLIPCYKGIDAYDMPKEFHRLQGQDMGKVGAVQDLLRGIEKILPRKEAVPQPNVQQVVQSGGPNTAALLQRGNMALEDGEWEKAKDYFDQVLNMDAQCAEAYLGLAMAETECRDREAFAKVYLLLDSPVREGKNIARANRFGDEKLKNWLDGLEAARIADLLEKKSKREQANQYSGLIAAGCGTTFGLRSDGTVMATGDGFHGRCDVVDWRDITAVSAGEFHAVGLRWDGTVIATKYVGKGYQGQCEVDHWQDITVVAAGPFHTVGLRSDGSVVTAGYGNYLKFAVKDWRDIIEIAASQTNTYGLCSDGTVITADSSPGQEEIARWREIAAIAAGDYHIVGLRSDGTVVAAGENDFCECSVDSWQNIISVSAGANHTVGLRADGTVVAVGKNDEGQCNVDAWRDIVAVSAGSYHTVGLRSDGTLIATGDNESGECEVDGWVLFSSIATMEQERLEAHKRYEREAAEEAERAEQKRREATERAERERQETAERAERERKEAAELAERKRREAAVKAEEERQSRLAALNQEKAALTAELTALKGLFSGKRRKEIEVRLAEIDSELKKLQ